MFLPNNQPQYIHIWLPCFTSRSEGRHILSGALAVLLVASSVALELLDFPPLYWIIDSHALWHIATVPLPLLWWVLRDWLVSRGCSTNTVKSDLLD